MTHDRAFRPASPSKKGYNKTIDKFPEYVADPIKVATRKREGSSDERKWKPTHNRKSVPMVSVTTLPKNLKTEFPHIFRRHV
mmetsp:Transcript_46718/g.34243  ORF Transcript_46718/g.34243 Transcript_46718/m.34243 type:complete len:82 (+) Transcript_46718:719-964(+)